MTDYFIVERQDGIVTMTINRPEKLNMMTREMGEEFKSICVELSVDNSLRAVILTGAGKAFCAGGDLGWLMEKAGKPADENRRDMLEFYPLFLSVRDIKAPVIAAINGAAIGAGMCLPLACDIRLASRSARIGATFVKLGLNPGMGCTWTLPRLIGPQRALLVALTGRVMNAEEAYRLGMVEAVYDDDALMDEARKLAKEIAAAAPMAVRWAKKTVWQGVTSELDDILHQEAAGQAECFLTDDVREGIKATREKRKPVFRGS